MSIFGIRTHSHFSVDQSSFFVCGFCVFVKKNCVFEEEEQKSGFLSPKKKMVRVVSSRVRAVYKPYLKPLTYYIVNNTPRDISDTYPTRVRCLSACLSVRHTNTPQGCHIRASVVDNKKIMEDEAVKFVSEDLYKLLLHTESQHGRAEWRIVVVVYKHEFLSKLITMNTFLLELGGT